MEKIGNIIMGFISFIALGFVILVIVAAICVFASDVNASSKLEKGEITLKEYCDQVTVNGTSSMNTMPVKCLKFYQ